MRKFRKFCTRFLAVIVGRLLLIPFFPVMATATLGFLALALLGALTLDLLVSGDWWNAAPKNLPRP